MVNLLQGQYEKVKKYYCDSVTSDYFEFDFSYVSKDEKFKELDRFLWESKHLKTRYKNRYTGPVLMDVTSWNNHSTNEYFDAFMYFLKDNPDLDCTLFVQNRCKEELLDKLNEFFETSVIEVTEVKRKDITRKIGFIINEEDKKYV